MRLLPNKDSNYHNPQEIELLIRLGLGLSHLCDHKFKHNFLDIINPLSICGFDNEATSHFFLLMLNYFRRKSYHSERNF